MLLLLFEWRDWSAFLKSSWQSPGILHTIFFHRYFPCIRPSNIDVLDLTLPRIEDVELETLIDTRVSAFVRNHLSSTPNSPSGIGRGRIAVQFFDKRPRRVGMWFGGLTSNETEVCWETWTISVTIASPRTESGIHVLFHCHLIGICEHGLAESTECWLFNYRTYQTAQSHGENVTNSHI